MLSRTEVFTKKVKDHMQTAPVVMHASTSCGELVQALSSKKANSAVIVDNADYPIGIITEQDVCRRVTYQVPDEVSVSEVMSEPIKVIRSDDLLYQAIAQMHRSQLRHMPVIDSVSGKIIGGLELQNALAIAANQMVNQIGLLTHSDTVKGMEKTKRAQVDVANQLFADVTPAPEVQKFISYINNDLYRRIVELCIDQMSESEWGPPPLEFDVLVMGSGGRGESFLYPDQDNGFIIEDYPDESHDQIDSWFYELARRMTDALNQVGLPYCNGYVMATNPLWRKTVSQWRQQLDGWIYRGKGIVLRLADIFFDFVHVYGEGRFTADLRNHVTEAAVHPHFLRKMFEIDAEHEVALGMFNRLLVDPFEGPNKGKLNLKLMGTLPLVGAVRLSALANGIPETSTLTRIRLLGEKNIISSNEQDYITGAFEHITNLVLRQQLRDFEASRKVGNHVSLSDLSKRERDMLVDGFQAIKGFKNSVRIEMTQSVL